MSERLRQSSPACAGIWLAVVVAVMLAGAPQIADAAIGNVDGPRKITQPKSRANIAALQAIALQHEARLIALKPQLYFDLIESQLPHLKELNDNPDIALQFISESGRPAYYTIHNVNAQATISTDNVQPGGSSAYNKDGSDTAFGELGIWDGGSALSTHQEFGGRLAVMDGAASHWHSTHVGATMVASGVVAAAEGMSPAANLRSWEWTNDTAEMAGAAAAGMLVSNHSYGFITGWYWNGSNWYWYGDVDVNNTEDFWFGAYLQGAVDWDAIMYNAPDYQIVHSAGNDRNDSAPVAGTFHYHWSTSSGWVWSNDSLHGHDYQNGGYDTLPPKSNAKNVLVVGAVNDIPGGYVNPAGVVQSTFSGWGPTDDGRIKPDIVGNGVQLYSAHNASNTAYANSDGTSMASPNVSGSINLITQSWIEWTGHPSILSPGPNPRSSTIRAIVLNSADEAGPGPGPDYQNGWGLMNTEKAMDMSAHNASATPSLLYPGLSELGVYETELIAGETHEFYFTKTTPASEVASVMIAWTDPAGPVDNSNTLNPTAARLVNDLDIRMVRLTGGGTVSPWTLNPASPGAAATYGDNFRDNVEKIDLISHPQNEYKLVVTHKGGLSGGSQEYALSWRGLQPKDPGPSTAGGVVSVTSAPYASAHLPDDNSSAGYYMTALKDYTVTAIGMELDLVGKQNLTVRIYEANGNSRGALLASASATVNHPGDVFHYVPINFTFEECKEYDVSVSFGWVRHANTFTESPAQPFDIGGVIRVRNGEFNGSASNVALYRLSFVGEASSALAVDLDPMQGTTKLAAGGSGDSNQGRGFYFRAHQTVSMIAFGMEVDHAVGQTLTANLYAAIGTARGALLATGEIITSGSGLIWHDVPINYVLEEGEEYDLEIFLGDTTLWNWWNENLLTEPFIKGPIEVVDSEQGGNAGNYALPHFRVFYDEGVGAVALDITQPFLTGTNPGSGAGGFDFGHFVSALRDQQLTTVGWMADIPPGESITINVFNATGLVRGSLVTSGTLVSNGPGMRWHDVPVAVSLVGGQDYDIAINWTGAPGAVFNFWQYPVHSPYNAYGLFSVYGSEFGGTPAGGGEYVHMRVNSCLNGVATGVEPRRNTPVPFALHAPYPNPVSSNATIDFTLDTEASVTMNVYDVAGRRVAKLLDNEARPAGLSSVNFNTRSLPTGIYFVKMQTAVKSVTRKITVMR